LWNIGLDRGKVIAFGVAVAALIVSTVLLRFFSTFEREEFDWLLRFIFAVLLAGLLSSAMRFFMIWYQLRRLLRRLAFHPLSEAFKRLDPKFARGLGTHFSAAPSTIMELEEPVNMLARLKHRLEVNKQLTEIRERLKGNLPIIEGMYFKEINAASGLTRRTWSFSSLTQGLLSREAAFIFGKLESQWKSPSADEASVQCCENFIAVQIVAFLNYVFLHLRYLLTCTASGAVLLLFATASYPFYLQNLMMNFAWAMLLTMALVYLIIFYEMSKNAIIVRVATGAEGAAASINRRLISQIFIFGLIPIVTFLGTQFPILGRILFSWMTPALKAFNF